jgi:hypothetical protein
MRLDGVLGDRQTQTEAAAVGPALDEGREQLLGLVLLLRDCLRQRRGWCHTRALTRLAALRGCG